MSTPTPLPHRPYQAFLFDMDGTLLSSLASAERVWSEWARRHGLDVERFLPTIHGRQATETIRDQHLPGIDVAAEAHWVLQAEMADVGDIAPIAGAAAFLASLLPDRWIIVTSATHDLALRRLEAAGLPASRLMVTAEDVAQGKPAPDAYLVAARKLGFPIKECLVFEDAPAGIASGEASGADVIVVTALHKHPLATARPTIASFDGIRAAVDESGTLRIELAA